MGIPDTFKALSDGTRREILRLLKGGAMTAGEITASFPMTGATVSHHLAVLRDAGLISDEKRGKYIYYELNMTVIDEIMGWMTGLKGGGEEISQKAVMKKRTSRPPEPEESSSASNGAE